MKYAFNILLSIVRLIAITIEVVWLRKWRCVHASCENDVLILCTDFLPRINGGTYRPLSWLRNSKQFQINVDVVTSDCHVNSVSAELEKQIPKTVNRFFVSDVVYIYRFARLFTDRPSFLLSAYNFCKKKYLIKWPSHIIATGPGFSSFIVATALANRYRAKLILDYRDEWSGNPFGFVAPAKWDLFFEKKCLERANLVIFTTESQKQALLKKYNISDLDGKLIVIPNGFDLVEIPVENSSVLDKKNITISFAGALAEHTKPDLFLEYLKDAIEIKPALRNTIKVQFVGAKSSEARISLDSFNVAECISSIDQIDQTHLSHLLLKSDYLLLLVDERFERYIPGKLYEYIAMRKPVLVVGAGACGSNFEIRGLLDKFGEAYYISSGNDLLKVLYGEVRHCESFSSFKEFTEHYARDAIAQRFWNLTLDYDVLS